MHAGLRASYSIRHILSAQAVIGFGYNCWFCPNLCSWGEVPGQVVHKFQESVTNPVFHVTSLHGFTLHLDLGLIVVPV